MAEELSKQELSRYARHLVLPEVGKEGQLRLKNAKVLIIGAGGLGNPVAAYLAAAGVGMIGIVDHDKIDLSNLQRQVLYSKEDLGKPKVSIIKKQLEKINENVQVTIYNERLTSKNALEIIKDYDVVIDGSDNLPTRYLINDSCILLKKPWVYGSVYRFDGQVSVFNHDNGPCYRCLSPEPSKEIPSCSESGVLGVLPGIIGMVQATEAIKIILGKGKTLSGRLLAYNALDMEFSELKLRKNPECKACGKNAKIKLTDYNQICMDKKDEITVSELRKMMDSDDFELIDVREKSEWDMGRIEKAKLMPLSALVKTDFRDFRKFDKDETIIVYCRSGNRSGHAAKVLKEKGFTNVKNLVGGINAWAREIDNNVTVY